MKLVEYAERLDKVEISIIVGFSLIFISIVSYIIGKASVSDVSAHLV